MLRSVNSDTNGGEGRPYTLKRYAHGADRALVDEVAHLVEEAVAKDNTYSGKEQEQPEAAPRSLIPDAHDLFRVVAAKVIYASTPPQFL